MRYRCCECDDGCCVLEVKPKSDFLPFGCPYMLDDAAEWDMWPHEPGEDCENEWAGCDGFKTPEMTK